MRKTRRRYRGKKTRKGGGNGNVIDILEQNPNWRKTLPPTVQETRNARAEAKRAAEHALKLAEFTKRAQYERNKGTLQASVNTRLQNTKAQLNAARKEQMKGSLIDRIFGKNNPKDT